ncbi:hypothetical protein [Streptomyces nodosus]|uniref:hypothetical protein n=1 Tax=Streptomyces nodosus TaxID=40318 RepID=UPI003F51A117
MSSVVYAVGEGVEDLKPGGVITVISVWGKSVWGKPASIDMQKLVLKEVDLRGTIAYVNYHPGTIKLVQEGRVDLAPFITRTIGLDDLVSDGFETLIHHNETAVKILVDPRL